MISIVFLVLAGIILGIGVLIAVFSSELKAAGAGAIVAGLVIAGLVFGFGGFYTQDPGQAMVLKSFSGSVAGQTTTTGIHTKAPWVNVNEYNVRNQQVVLSGSNETAANKGYAGPAVTIQDKDGATATINVVVRYSIDPDKVTDIYKEYGSEQDFLDKFVIHDTKAGVVKVPSNYTTIEMLSTKRTEAEQGVFDYLVKRWEDSGVRAESVSLQNVKYSKDVMDRFDQAQAARVEVEKAQAELEATEVSSQQKIVQAQAEAEANRILTQSLTPEVLQQRYLDTMTDIGKGGNLVVVPDDFNGILNMGK